MLLGLLVVLLFIGTTAEAEPDLRLVGFGDLQQLAQGQGVQAPRDERSLLNTYPFNQQDQLSVQSTHFPSFPETRGQVNQVQPSGVSQLALGLFSRGSLGRAQGYHQQVPAGTGLLTGLDSGANGFSLQGGFNNNLLGFNYNKLEFNNNQEASDFYGAAGTAVAAAASAPRPPAPPPIASNYDHLYAAAGTAAAAANLKARRPLPPSPAPEVLPQIYVGAVAAHPTVRVPPRLPLTTLVPEQEQDLDLFTSLNPNRARKPALGREPAGPLFPAVAEAKERCIDKIEHVEETIYDQVEECNHSYDKKCHTSYSTEYTSQQEKDCKESFSKNCDITYSPTAHNETVLVCSRPLVKDCSVPGPEECRTEYVSECWTKEEVHSVVDDVPECETVYDEQCHQEQSGYSTEEKCSKWPREVCTVNKKLKSKSTPATKCEKVPQKLCGPAGCGFVPGPEQCYEKTVTVVTDLPSENCNLHPRTQCEHVTKLVPKLVPVEECVDVPKEICQKVRGPPRTVTKPITKKWCYTPTPESGLH